MKFFKRKKDVVDLGDLYKKRQQKISEIRDDFTDKRDSQVKKERSGSFSPLGFFDKSAFSNSKNSEINENSNSEDYIEIGNENYSVEDSVIEKRKCLAKRLGNMTEKIEELSNSIYHLQQRLEVIERKLGISGFS